MSRSADELQDLSAEDGTVAYVDASLEALIPRYLSRRQDDADVIERAVAGMDWDTVAMLGHTMKGSGGGYGFDRITELGASIERAGRDEDADTALQAVARLRRYIDTVVIEFVEE